MKKIILLMSSVITICLFASTALQADEVRLGIPAEKLDKMRQAGQEYLVKTQNEDGSWSNPKVLGISALATTALLESGYDVDSPAVKKGLDYLMQYRQKDGGFYHPDSKHRNYETSIILMALTEANRDGKYQEEIAGAQKFLKGLQWDEGEGLSEDDPAYGGAGYGGHSRPDLSNTQFMLEALKKSGLSVDDPAFQKAVTFVSRTQNLDSEYNNTPFASRIDDGGFYYTPAAGGTSQAGQTASGGLRSYGSMTYAGLKSYIYAGLSKEDPRVQAALNWIKDHYTLNENPGMGQQGLFYYYHVFGKTMAVLGVEKLETNEGSARDWRKDLAMKLAETQRSDGSWINEADRWYESDPTLVTAYALMALAYCDPITAQN